MTRAVLSLLTTANERFPASHAEPSSCIKATDHGHTLCTHARLASSADVATFDPYIVLKLGMESLIDILAIDAAGTAGLPSHMPVMIDSLGDT